jgi:hypothetical protein
MNELTTLTGFQVDYETPGEIRIVNEEKLKELVDNVVTHYDNLVFNESNIAEAKEAKKDLSNLIKAIDEQRKAVKQAYTAPLATFESKLKEYAAKAKTSSDMINRVIKDYDAAEKAERLEFIKSCVAQEAKENGITADEFVINDSWANKGSFTTTGSLTKKVLKEITIAVQTAVTEKNRIIADKSVVTNYAKAVGLEVDGWADFVEKGQTAVDLIMQMDKTVKDRNERLEREKKQAETDAAIAKMEAEKAAELEAQQGEFIVNTETGEIVDDAVVDEPVRSNNNISDSISVTLKLTGTFGNLMKVNDFIISLGIEVKELKEA